MFEEIKFEFFKFYEQKMIEVFENYKMLILVATSNYKLSKCNVDDLSDCTFFSTELIIDKIMKDYLFKSNNQNENEEDLLKEFEKETYALQESNDFDFREFDDTSNESTYQVSDSNKLSTSNTTKAISSTYSNSSSVSTSIIQNSCFSYDNIKRDMDEKFAKLKFLVIGYQVNDIFRDQSNINSDYISQLLYSFDRLSITNPNIEFLKSFDPKFIKKENLDIKILRRFKKYLKVLFKNEYNNQTFIKERDLIKEKNDVNHSNKNSLVKKEFNKVENGYNNLAFAYKFSQNIYDPPVKLNKVLYKSINQKYLNFIFSIPILLDLYSTFGEEYAFRLTDLIKSEYNIENTDDKILNNMPFYIKNFGKLHSLNYDNRSKLQVVVVEDFTLKIITRENYRYIIVFKKESPLQNDSLNTTRQSSFTSALPMNSDSTSASNISNDNNNEYNPIFGKFFYNN